MRFRSITTLCLFGAAAFVALKYALIGLGICICCLIVYLGIIRIIALLGLACATGVSEAAAGSDTEQCRSDRHEAYRFMAASDDVSSARRRPATRRLGVEVRRQFFTDEPGTVYGYAPGNYILGGPLVRGRSQLTCDRAA
jgi:hypothetical protein